jgi:hypothetical protein
LIFQPPEKALGPQSQAKAVDITERKNPEFTNVLTMMMIVITVMTDFS